MATWDPGLMAGGATGLAEDADGIFSLQSGAGRDIPPPRSRVTSKRSSHSPGKVTVRAMPLPFRLERWRMSWVPSRPSFLYRWTIRSSDPKSPGARLGDEVGHSGCSDAEFSIATGPVDLSLGRRGDCVHRSTLEEADPLGRGAAHSAHMPVLSFVSLSGVFALPENAEEKISSINMNTSAIFAPRHFYQVTVSSRNTQKIGEKAGFDHDSTLPVVVD